MFPGRRGAGRIFHNQVTLSGSVPQVCVLFGPSAAGGAYIPAFCDLVIMREGNASMYLGSPRMAEMVIGEKVSLEEMGGARMHTGVSGCGHQLVESDEQAIACARRYLSYLPTNWLKDPPTAEPRTPAPLAGATAIADLIPDDENRPFDMITLIEALVDEGSVMEIHPRWARELIVGFARLDGMVVGHRRQPAQAEGGVLFIDSADKAARFIWTCNAFNVPLLFLADVPGFMIGTKVEREGIIRHGAKMISAVSEATVPKISVSSARPTAPVCTPWPARPSSRTLHRAAERIDRRDGAAGGDQRRLLQPAAGDQDEGERARRTEELREEYARGHRHPAPCLGAGDRRGDRAGCAARGADPPLRSAHGQSAAAGAGAGVGASATRSRPSRHRRRDGHPRPRIRRDRPPGGADRTGEISSRELVEVYLARIERLDPLLNAFRVVFAERARLEADQADARRGAGGSGRCSACRSRSRTKWTSPAS